MEETIVYQNIQLQGLIVLPVYCRRSKRWLEPWFCQGIQPGPGSGMWWPLLCQVQKNNRTVSIHRQIHRRQRGAGRSPHAAGHVWWMPYGRWEDEDGGWSSGCQTPAGHQHGGCTLQQEQAEWKVKILFVFRYFILCATTLHMMSKA